MDGGGALWFWRGRLFLYETVLVPIVEDFPSAFEAPVLKLGGRPEVDESLARGGLDRELLPVRPTNSGGKEAIFFAQLRLGSVMVLQEVFVLGWIRVEEQVILKVFRRAALRLDVVAGQLDDAEDGGGELPGAGDVGGVVLGVVGAGDLAHLADHQVPVGASANPAL